METIQKKISVNDFTGETINLPVYLSQDINELGIYTDIHNKDILDCEDFSTDDTFLLERIDKDCEGLPPFITISGFTSSRLEEVSSYNRDGAVEADNYNGEPAIIIDGLVYREGVNGVVSITSDSIIYNIDDFTYQTLLNLDRTTIFSGTFHRARFCNYNIIKEEEKLGVVFPGEVNDHVDIDRGGGSVMSKHQRLGEVIDLKHLEDYGEGFFGVTRA